MLLARKVAAVVALATLGGLMLTLDRGAYGVNPRLLVVTRVFLVPLGVTMVGLALERVWGRWLALAAALAVLPWAAVLTFGLPQGAPLLQQSLALAASLLLLFSITGRAMFDRYEGRARMDWRGPRLGLVRWTVILNLASVLSLFLFVALYRYSVQWHLAIPLGLFLALLAGVLLLAFQKTAGLLLVALACVLFLPAGAYFVWQEARDTGEMYLFGVCFLPGIVAGWACLFAFGGPVWRLLRAD